MKEGFKYSRAVLKEEQLIIERKHSGIIKQEQKAADVGQRNADMVKELAELQRKLE